MEKIAIFGAGLSLDNYYQMLSSIYDIAYLVDNDETKWGRVYHGKECYSPRVLVDIKVDKIIILTIWKQYADEIRKQLAEMGFTNSVFRISELQPIIERKDIREGFHYSDSFNNSIIVEDDVVIPSLKVEFIGINNRLVIHKNVRVMSSLFCSFRGDESAIEIGKDTSIVGCNIYVAEGGNVRIGDDCMFGHQITIMQSACHPIFDISTGKRCNVVKDINIGKHVWLGQGVSLMPGFSIGNGSIVGLGSISSSVFGDNCTIAGNPARVIRENCTWKRDAVGY